MKRAILIATAGAVLLWCVQAGGPVNAQAAGPDALSFFKNYIITGDYRVAGIGLRGKGVNGIATGAIDMKGVPDGAEIAAAFLYWQVVVKDANGPESGSLPVTFRGHPLKSADGPFGKQLGAGTAPCWSAGGGTGSAGGTYKTYSYRADVMRLFAINESTGKFVVNDLHQVQLPDGGGFTALGASLVVLFRDPAMPLSAIVMYDGAYTMDQNTQSMSQRMKGFYQPSTTAGKLTHIVGSGQANKSERVLFNGNLIATNPFQSVAGESWDNPTFPVTSPISLTEVTASVDHAGFSTFDCLTWIATLYRVEVQDTDLDGLIDVWETNAASSAAPLVDPRGRPLPYLADMGASPTHKDAFVEIGYMATASQTSYGGIPKPAHTHLPTHEVFRQIGDTFKNAPEAIAIHFDVGAGYPAGDPLDPAKNADEYIIRGAGLARGGEAIDEMATVCQRGPTDPPWVCQYSEHAGTVGWKTGFRYLRDEVLSVTPPSGMPAPPPGEDYCETPGYSCNRRFDANRRNIFRYTLFAHALGVPRSEEPCLDAANNPVPGNSSTGLCSAPLKDNPKFHVPGTNTGVGDFHGGDTLITLGAFSDAAGKPIGTALQQVGTFLHEFGHNAGRRHGGEPSAPNCTPTYLSVMNYLYQLRGFLDEAGRARHDFSRQVISPAINERSLVDGSHSGLPSRIGYYVPLAGSYLDGIATAAAKHCDGSSVLPLEPAMVRVDSATAAGAIDWNANGLLDSAYTSDVNFNGRTQINGAAETLNGSDDWSNMLLNQTAARRNTGALYVDPTGHLAVGPLSLDSGRGDLGRGDLGRGDLGRGDLGRGDLGRGDLGRGDLGRGDLGRGDLGALALGRGDLGRGDLGGGDMFLNDPLNPSGELDYETANAGGKAAPTGFTACVIGVDCSSQTSPLHRVRTDWKAPEAPDLTGYAVYRVKGAGLLTGAERVLVGQVNPVAGQLDYSLLDNAQLKNGAPYTYFAIALYADGSKSGPSNLIVITAVNDPPVAVNDSYVVQEGTSLVVPAAGVLANDSDPDSPLTAVLIAGPANGTLQLQADGSFTYTPAAGFAGIVSFKYGATDTQSVTPATATIEVRRQQYGFIGVQNLPAVGKVFNVGSSVPLRWQFTVNGVVVNSAAAQPEITVRNPAGTVIYKGHPGDPGSSSFQPPTASNGYTWQFNWQTKGLVAGTYSVYVGSLFTGQSYDAGRAFGPFAATLK